MHLEVLAAGGTLEEVELPLYTTCSRLFGAGGDIREAVVSSALGQLGDLGGSRISKALGVFFAERNAPTLLVIDSLDEAHGPSERLRQAEHPAVADRSDQPAELVEKSAHDQ